MDKEKLLEYKWGSNKPVIKTIMDFFSPTGIMELGIGKYSTPLLYQYNKKLISIETDGEWIKTVKEIVPPRDNFQTIHHKLGIQHKTKFNQISEKVKQECVNFYKQYMSLELEFLFVDHISGLRSSSLLALFDKFKYIAYHDAEPSQYRNYNYQVLTKENTKNYIHLMNPTPLVYTGILIHKDYKDVIKEFIEILNKNNEDYCKTYNKKYETKVYFI